jgi:hypothetical protein
MKITARIELSKKLTAKINELKMPLSGGYEQGFEDGKEAGYVDGVKDGEAIGYEKGHADGYSEGYSEGSVYYDQFWDAYQQNGERNDYSNAFSVGWNSQTFAPKYKNMSTKSASSMFSNSAIEGDLREYANIDFSKSTNFSNSFYYAKFSAIGVIDARGASSLSMTFLSSTIRTIEKVILKEDGSQSFSSTFSNKWLKEIRFEGVIGKTIDFKTCPLSVDSMKDIIAHLKDFNGTGKENSVKVSFSDACWSSLEADSTAPNGGTWKEYVQFTLCWNV